MLELVFNSCKIEKLVQVTIISFIFTRAPDENWAKLLLEYNNFHLDIKCILSENRVLYEEV